MWFPADSEAPDEDDGGDVDEDGAFEIDEALAHRCILGLGVVLGKRTPPWIRSAPFFFSAVIERQANVELKRAYKAHFISDVLGGKAKSNRKVTIDPGTPNLIRVKIDDPSAYAQATSAKIWTAPLEAVSDEEAIREQLKFPLKVLEKPRT